MLSQALLLGLTYAAHGFLACIGLLLTFFILGTLFGRPGRTWLVWGLSSAFSITQPVVQWLLPVDLQMFALTMAFIPSRVLYVVTNAGVPDVLAKLGSATAEEIAAALPGRIHSPHLFRLMRLLASMGVYNLDSVGRFSPTQLGRTLTKNNRGWSLRSMVLTMNDPEDHQLGWNALDVALQKGGVAFEHATGGDVWKWYTDHPTKGARFDETMEVMSVHEKHAVAEAIDWTGIRTVVDIGGGNGTVARHLATRHPHLEAIVFERPSVVDAVETVLASEGSPLKFVTGDMFDAETFKRLPKVDAIVLKRILHDWGDEECVQILKNVRTIMHSLSKLYVIDFVIDDRRNDGLSILKLVSDVNMLTMVNGQERTRSEFEELMKRAGLRISQCSDALPSASIIEARLV